MYIDPLKPANIHTFEVDSEPETGHQLYFMTKVKKVNDNLYHLDQCIELFSYGFSSQLHVFGSLALTPEKLRKMADELEKFIIKEKSS